MLEAGGAEQKDGGAGGTTGLPNPMSGGVLKGEKPWYHKDVYFPGVPRPPPGTPYGSRGATIIRTDPCVIDDPDMEKNHNFVKTMTPEDAERYRGEWIGLAGGRVIAHGNDYGRVYDETCKAEGTPFMHCVAPAEEEAEPAVFFGWY